MTTSHSTDAGQGPPGRRPPRSGPLGARRLRIALPLLVLLALVVGAVVDGVLVVSRVDQLDVDLSGDPGDSDGRTWVLVGVDSRAHLPEASSAADFGTPDDVPGSRADVIVVVHQTDAGTSAWSVPRDVLVRTGAGTERLALTWLDGPQATVEGLCGLGIPTDHLVAVDLAGFASVVDASGGLDVDVPEVVRDQPAGLAPTPAGRQHVDGATALALVRSRHPEHLVDGQWAPAPIDPDGRASAAGRVLSSLLARVRGSSLRPWRLQALAWAASGAVAVDPGTSAGDLTSLAGADPGQVRVLPAGPPIGSSVARRPRPATYAAVEAAGMSCAP
jgi:LCP family protein required for cell wall assembly